MAPTGRIETPIATLKQLDELRKYVDSLVHRIELLELRLGNKSFGKQEEPPPEPKPMSGAYKRIIRNAKAKKAKQATKPKTRK